MEEYRRKLFSAGMAGAYSFPAAAPLAEVSRPYSEEELKALARDLRELSVLDCRDGKFHTAGTGRVPWDHAGSPDIFGLKLEFTARGHQADTAFSAASLRGLRNAKVRFVFSECILCAGLGPGSGDLPEAPCFSFRAAKLANLAVRPLDSGEGGYSFEWKTGTPVWLPGYKKAKRKDF
ncbi:MAG: hypothetical protein LBC62_06085 [Treponema sp.]|nr:hypothetical protein [Treponema sp.]